MFVYINGNPSFSVWYADGVPFFHTTVPTGATGFNTFLGKNAGNFNTVSTVPASDGSFNTGIGESVLNKLTDGQGNTIVGAGSASAVTTGDENNVLGAFCQVLNTAGVRNQSVGQNALRNVSASDNIGIGGGAGYGMDSGSRNILIGTNAGNNGGGALNGASGTPSTFAMVSGSNNIAIGVNAGQDSTTQISNCILIGSSVTSSVSNQTVIGSTQITQRAIYGVPINAFLASTVTNPGSAAASVMAGFNKQFTPRVSGVCRMTVQAAVANDVAANGGFFAIRYGTGTPPTNGSASTGTAVGALVQTSQQSSAAAISLTAVGVAAGLTIGTQYWIDVVFGRAVASGTVALTQVYVLVEEW